MKWEYLSGAMADFVDGHSGYVFISAIINEGHRITLNELGDHGWELVTVVDHIAYFKRPRKSELPKEDREALALQERRLD
jgi:hypothetical protein